MVEHLHRPFRGWVIRWRHYGWLRRSAAPRPSLDCSRSRPGERPVVVGSKAVGIICTCDLEEAALSESISSIAHSPARTIAPDALLSDAAHWMKKAAVGSLIVETEGKMVGILTRTDLERAGLADPEFRESACLGCGSFEHVHPNASGEWWCARCRAHRGPARGGDDIGVGD